MKLALGSDGVAAGLVEEVFAVREEEGEAMSRLPSRIVQLRDRCCGSSRRRDAGERFAEVRFEDNHTVPAPGAATSIRCVAHGQDRSARGLDSLQLAAAEESD